jgi:hypothetical protein
MQDDAFLQDFDKEPVAIFDGIAKLGWRANEQVHREMNVNSEADASRNFV